MDDGLSLLVQTTGPDDLATLRSAGATLGTLLSCLDSEGRPRLLASLKEFGVGSLSARQQIANALQRYVRTGDFAGKAAVTESQQELSAAPPGSITVQVRCAGALGGDNCALLHCGRALDSNRFALHVRMVSGCAACDT